MEPIEKLRTYLSDNRKKKREYLFLMESIGWGQVVIGPPGSGKSTYCRGVTELLVGAGREVFVVNLDPANEQVLYEAALDVQDLIRLEDVMEELELGPNGGIIYCLEFLEKNVEWLLDGLRRIMKSAKFPYFLFDLPGQVELSTHHESLRNIVGKIQKILDLRLTAVHLVDSFHCSDPSKYISAVFLSLSAMLRLEMPHVNVMSKVDLVEKYGTLDFGLDFYMEVQNLDYLLPMLQQGNGVQLKDEKEESKKSFSTLEAKHAKLHATICDLIEQYSLVAFHPLNIQDRESVVRLIKQIDNANGFTELLSMEERDIFENVGPLNWSEISEKYLKEMGTP